MRYVSNLNEAKTDGNWLVHDVAWIFHTVLSITNRTIKFQKNLEDMFNIIHKLGLRK